QRGTHDRWTRAMTAGLAMAGASLAVWIYLIAARGGFWLSAERDENEPADAPRTWPAVAAVIPARDEADVVAESLGSLLRQDYRGPFTIVLVDDQSRDATADVARVCAAREGAADRLTVVPGRKLPAGWSGKIFAIKQGIDHVESRTKNPPAYLLLTDADIFFAPDALTTLVARAQAGKLVLTSLMA